jgi:hypothetical protein
VQSIVPRDASPGIPRPAEEGPTPVTSNSDTDSPFLSAADFGRLIGVNSDRATTVVAGLVPTDCSGRRSCVLRRAQEGMANEARTTGVEASASVAMLASCLLSAKDSDRANGHIFAAKKGNLAAPVPARWSSSERERPSTRRHSPTGLMHGLHSFPSGAGVADATPLKVYRIVKTDPPTVTDCTPQAQLGRRLVDPTPEKLHLWSGLSVFATEAQARRQARSYPMLGGFIAEIVFPPPTSEGLPFDLICERTLRTPGHYTLWAVPALLLACVTRVVPVRR